MLRFETDSTTEPVPPPLPEKLKPAALRKPVEGPWTVNIVFVALTHIIAIASLLMYRPSSATLILCLFLWQAAGIGVTMGYHRLWSHRTFEAALPLRLLLALLGTIAFQGSIKWWVIRHRLHHRFVDTDNDPHNSMKGLWYSHIGWIFERREYSKRHMISMRDINADPIVRFQHKYFVPLAFSLAFALPTLICSMWGDALGGLLYGGFILRILIWHSVFSINSLAHYVGSQEFSDKISARGNWLLAFLTGGEGHHNFHHEFPHDYRNGIKWFDYDPTKWAIQLAAYFGLAWNLRSVPSAQIEKARNRALIEKEAPKHELVWPKMHDRELWSRCRDGEQLLVIDGWVLDAGPYLEEHPGGAEIVLEWIGKDASAAFNGEVNRHSQSARILTEKYRVARYIANNIKSQ